MDITTIVGLISGFTLLIMGIYNGGDLSSFVDVGSFLIVVGGSFAACLIGFPLLDIVRFPGVLRYAFYIPGSYGRIAFPEQYPSDPSQMAKAAESAATIEEELKLGIVMLKQLKTYAMAFGWMAVLIGVIIMLGHLDDPKAIGPGMALALISMFYGVVIAYLLCVPLKTKLERRLEAMQK